MRTLLDILGMLPRVLSKRYSPAFWVYRANTVLQDVEWAGEKFGATEEAGIILKDGLTDYKLPSYVQKSFSLSQLLPGDLSIRPRYNSLDFRERRGWLEILSPIPSFEENLISGEISPLSNERGIFSPEFIVSDGSTLKGQLLEFKTGLNAGFNRLIVKHDGATGFVTLKRDMPHAVDTDGNPSSGDYEDYFNVTALQNDEVFNSTTIEIANDASAGSETIEWLVDKVILHVEVGASTVIQMLAGTNVGTPWADLINLSPADLTRTVDVYGPILFSDLVDYVPGKGPDTFVVAKDFAILEYACKIDRITDESCPLLIDDDLAIVIEHGLRYYGESQTDEESEFSHLHKRNYEEAKRKYTGRAGRIVETRPKFYTSSTK